MKRSILVLFVLVLGLAGCKSKTEDLQDVTLMLDYTPNTNHTGIYVADSLGYYKDEGINLNIIQPSDVATESAVASGTADFGISYGENVAQFDQDSNDIVSIMSILNTNTSGFLSRADRNITRPKDFEGKTYCGWGSDIESALLKTLMKRDGGDYSKVKSIVASTNLMSDKDQCDFIWAYAGWDKLNLEQNDVDINYIPVTDYGVDWYTPVVITSSKMIEENSDLVQSFINATVKGYQYAIDNPTESADILLKAAPELDADLVQASQAYLSPLYADNQGRVGYQDDNKWDSFMLWLKDSKIITQADPSGMYTNDYINPTLTTTS